MIILDFGSGNTCKNSVEYACTMVKALADITDRRDDIVIKWQLFKEAGKNVPLSHEVYSRAHFYAQRYGFETTASVFDSYSLEFALKHALRWVKLTNIEKTGHLIKEVPDLDGIIISTNDADYKKPLRVKNDRSEIEDISMMYCISEYPAKAQDYEKKFGDKLKTGISDHTTDFSLYKKYRPKLYECHFKLDDSTGLDAGPFARTPEQLKEILNETLSDASQGGFKEDFRQKHKAVSGYSDLSKGSE